MKKTFIVIYILICLVMFKLLSAFIINERFISEYSNNIYEKDSIKILKIFNIFEPCIFHYNYGNILYQNEDYDGAIEEYNKSLKLFPSKNKECSIRINLALAMLKKMDVEIQEKDEILEILSNAKNVLCENGCANLDNDNGHSKEAEKLKADIEKMEKKLQDKEDIEDNKKDDNKEDKKGNNKNDTIEEKLKEIQKESASERNEQINQVKGLEKIEYYNGKKW